jgi:hypothetical protein
VASHSYPEISGNRTPEVRRKRDAIASSLETIVIRRLLIAPLLLFVSAASGAADVHKCVTPTGISYQGSPCNGPELPTSIVVASAAQSPAISSGSARDLPANAGQPPAADNSRTAPDCDTRSPRVPLPPRNATICIGMTDDEVLNLAGWGRPAKIVRTRVPREWREQWIYDTRAAGLRQLHFVNGKLALVETEVIEPRIASMTRFAYN